MIGVNVASNVGEVRAQFSALADGLQDKAIVRALNRALDQSATEASRQIRKVYNVKAQAVSAAMKKKRAYKSPVPAATLEIRGVRFGLIEFDPRQTRQGVSLRIRKDSGRNVLRHAFITTLVHGNGYRGVFVRTGRERYPIKALRSISVPGAFMNEAVLAAVKATTRESFTKTLRQQVRFLQGKSGG